MPAPKPGPYKPWDEKDVGKYVQNNYAFMDKLFGTGGAALRKKFWDCTTETDLRNAINAEAHIGVPDTGVRVGVFDVEVGDFKVITPIKPASEAFYIMVMPPMPRRKKPPSPDYNEGQAWEDAWYHAIVDGYGM